jgi:DNA-binding transcriptional ArsR family regulator
VALVLMKWMDRKGSAYPAVATLARAAKISERAVGIHLEKLVKAGWLTRTERPRKDGRQAPHLYQAKLRPRPNEVQAGQTERDDNPRPNETQSQTERRSEEGLKTEGLKKEDPSLYSLSPSSPSKAKPSTPASQSSPSIAAPAKSGIEEKNQPSPFPSGRFLLTKEMFAFAEKLGLDRDQTKERTSSFKDHALAHGWCRADWVAAWRAWIRRSVKLDPPPADDEPIGWSGDYGQR